MIVYASITSKDKYLQYIKYPEIGDVCVYEPDEGGYSSFKINSISSDTLFFIMNDYAADNYSSIELLYNDSCYSDNIFFFSKQDYLDLYDKGDIYKIKRTGF